ncbi:MAG TPA: pyrroloquinoline quinone biosynthesis protein PqqB [Hyphomicrobiaceae bacterium]|jgi:pyrroloquinoline quinone biosynthesis protein B|nr:pyrroloquinoline quinone biosynthesis protein PqqB [Hyphomicrobiaceae bacterium]
MFIKVLGSSAGGGLPQLNCSCRNCADARRDSPAVRKRTQSCVAVSGDGQRWTLLNASPDLRQQFQATPQLWPPPDSGLRACPVTSIILTNADVDHVAGLLSLREGVPFTLYASETVLAALAANPIYAVLDPSHVARVPLSLERSLRIGGGLTVEAFPVPGKVALYLESSAPGFGTRTGDTVGLQISDPANASAFHFIPGCAAIDAALAARLRGSALVLFDGTLYTDEEMIVQGLSAKTGRRMGHIAMAGPQGSIAAFAALQVKRRVFVHMNNSNPALREDSPERAEVEGAGWEIAWDGMEIEL